MSLGPPVMKLSRSIMVSLMSPLDPKRSLMEFISFLEPPPIISLFLEFIYSCLERETLACCSSFRSWPTFRFSCPGSSSCLSCLSWPWHLCLSYFFLHHHSCCHPTYLSDPSCLWTPSDHCWTS